MKLPAAPDLAPDRRLVLTALAAALIMACIMGWQDGKFLSAGLGDTDDATRLMMARALLHGQGWWDQRIVRFQPPMGVYMHWSRLLDGGIAAMMGLFRLVMPESRAEWLTRFLWPMLWLVPACIAALLLTRRLAEGPARRRDTAGAAVLIAALCLVTTTKLGDQFRPGRIDHHDVQIVLAMLALLGGCLRGPSVRGAALAGLATGVGLAIGLEALAFDVLVGAAFALAFAFDPKEARRLETYGATLGLSTLSAFCLQTPPWRWSVSACDAMALNLVGGIAVASGALVLAARLTERRALPWRLGALSLGGALAAAAYVKLDPNCLHGIFADVDPAVRPFWLDHVQEVRPLWVMFKREPENALALGVPAVLGCLAWGLLAVRRDVRRDQGWLLFGAVLLATTVAGFLSNRMAYYADWLAVAPIGAAAAALVQHRYARGGLFAVVLAGAIAQPMTATGLGLMATQKPAPKPGARKPRPDPPDYCYDSASYRDLARLPAGTTLSEIDLGPFVTALTPSSSMSAPYHRMSWGILQARHVLVADADDPGPDGAYALARRLRVTYVLECRRHANHVDRDGLAPNSLQAVLDRGDWPDWLELENDEDAPIRVFKIVGE